MLCIYFKRCLGSPKYSNFLIYYLYFITCTLNMKLYCPYINGHSSPNSDVVRIKAIASYTSFVFYFKTISLKNSPWFLN